MSKCPDLRQIAGNRFKLAHEHKPDVRATDDPWLLTIPCQYGHVYPHGDGVLAFASDIRGGVARAVAALAGAVVVQDGDDGMNITFPVTLFAKVARIVKPRKRRQITDAERQRLSQYAFKPRLQIASSPRISTKATRDDSKHVPADLEAILQ